ncbi:hypothetical protein O3M35_002587 [Rhynocoris fuscipes]|uniref:Odorant receptor n=1 Tax=Rhynocoris fuscipes TaxID=488301 RepID=A0AAW1CKU2_9HEMI
MSKWSDREWSVVKSKTLFPKVQSLTNLSFTSFKLAGLMNIEGKRWITLYMAYQWIITHLAFITSVIELLVGGKEINHLVPTLSSSIVTVVIISKLYLFFMRRDQICNILNRLDDIRLQMLKNEENVALVAEAEKFGKNILLGLFLMYIGAPIPSFTVNTVNEYMSNFKRKHNLIKIWLPWSRVNNKVHILSNGLTTMMTIAIRFVYIGFYSMEITFTFYVSAYIKTLQNNLINKGIKNKDIYEQHKVIIQLINDYNEVLSGQMYFEILIAPLIPCGFGLSVIKMLLLRGLTSIEAAVIPGNDDMFVICWLPDRIRTAIADERQRQRKTQPGVMLLGIV